MLLELLCASLLAMRICMEMVHEFSYTIKMRNSCVVHEFSYTIKMRNSCVNLQMYIIERNRTQFYQKKIQKAFALISKREIAINVGIRQTKICFCCNLTKLTTKAGKSKTCITGEMSPRNSRAEHRKKQTSARYWRGENLPIEPGVMNLHDRFYMALFAFFTKSECSASFLNQANHETEVRTITRHYCIIYEFKQ